MMMTLSVMMMTLKERRRIRFFKIINFCHQMIDLLNAEVYGKRADITAISDEGKAYLEVVNYVKKQQKQNQVIANIRITPSLSLTSGSYETPKSKFRVICYTDEQEKHKETDKVKVLKY